MEGIGQCRQVHRGQQHDHGDNRDDERCIIAGAECPEEIAIRNKGRKHHPEIDQDQHDELCCAGLAVSEPFEKPEICRNGEEQGDAALNQNQDDDSRVEQRGGAVAAWRLTLPVVRSCIFKSQRTGRIDDQFQERDLDRKSVV